MSMFTESTSHPFRCDVEQGFNYDSSKKTIVGFVYKLKIDELQVPEEFEVVMPDTEEKKKVAGVIKDVYWSGTVTQPIEVQVQIGPNAKAQLQELVYSTMKNIAVEIEYAIFQYDSRKGYGKYFPAFHTMDAPLIAKLTAEETASGTKMGVLVNNDASQEVFEPENYTLALNFEAQGSQDLGRASGEDIKFVLPIGIEVGG